MNTLEAFAAIDRLGLSVFHREKQRGDEFPKWTVRKEDAAGNTVVQVRDADLLTAVKECSELLAVIQTVVDSPASPA